MSWGERSCATKDCNIAKINTCNVDCKNYKWDGKTKPDSKSLKAGLAATVKNQEEEANQKSLLKPNFKPSLKQMSDRCYRVDENGTYRRIK